MNGVAITRWVLVVAAATLLAACATQDPRLYSTLWLQTAAEYRAETLETYAAAEARLDEALTDPSWTAALEQTEGYSGLPPAVILDIDETVLDNAPFQGELLLEKASFDPARWDRWVAEESAAALPGALAFTQKAVSRGISVFYVTNRSCPRDPGGAECPQETHTVNNLRRLGFPEVTPERVLLKREAPGWGSEKDTRRRFLAKHHRILMLVGDDLGDFLPGVKQGISPARRKDLVDRYSDHWGRMWFIIPNPVYGSWERVLPDPKAVQVRGF
jgi:acid phosphatase